MSRGYEGEVMNASKVIKLVTETGEMIIENIEEYVCGFSYFYVRFSSGDSTSFDRRLIRRALRKLPTGEFRPIHLKKPKVKSSLDDSESECEN
jgi:hypothetical protein